MAGTTTAGAPLAPSYFPADPGSPDYFGGNSTTRVVTVNGRQLLIDDKGNTIKDLGAAGGSSDNTPSVDGAGVQFTYVNGRPARYVRQEDGTYGFIPYEPVPVATNPHPGVSVSSSTSQSFQDPRALALQEQAQAQSAAQAKAQLDEQIRVNNATIAQQQANLMIQMQNASFLDKKFQFESEQAKQTNNLALARDARETQQQLFAQNQAVSTLQLNIAQAQYQRDSLQAQLQQSTDQFNAKTALETQQLNEQAKQAKTSQLLTAASNIAEAASHPTDAGKAAALILATPGFGQTSTAIGRGVNLTSTNSLAPLESELRTRNDILARPDNPYSFNPVTAPQVAPLDLSKVNIPQVGQSIPGATNVIGQGVVGGGTGQTPAGYSSASQAQFDKMAAAAAASQGTTAVPTNLDRGGDISNAKPIIVGERGIELGLPDGNGGLVFMNQKEAKNYGLDLKKLSKMQSAQAPTNFDGGGVFGQFGNVQDSDRSLATSFLSEASSRARAGTPFASGNLPAPVYASSPGFNPYVTGLIASLQAIQNGVPADYFTSEAQRLAPVGVNNVRSVSRTA